MLADNVSGANPFQPFRKYRHVWMATRIPPPALMELHHVFPGH
jgi:hypothetical protein